MIALAIVAILLFIICMAFVVAILYNNGYHD